jgi:hypothetical protein
LAYALKLVVTGIGAAVDVKAALQEGIEWLKRCKQREFVRLYLRLLDLNFTIAFEGEKDGVAKA